MALWPSGQVASQASPHTGTNPARLHPCTHPTDDSNVQRHERASVIFINDKKTHQTPKGHQYIVYKITVIICKLTHKEKQNDEQKE